MAGGRPKLSTDVLAEWKARLAAATEAVQLRRNDAQEAELELRAAILEAFGAGLSVTPIIEATGLSLGRIYQIKRGTRR